MDERPRMGNSKLAAAVVLALSIALVGWTFWPLWQPLLLAAVLSGVTHGWHRWLTRRLGQRPRIAATIMTLGLIVLVLGPVAVLVAVLVREALQVVHFVQDALAAGGFDELAARLPRALELPLRRAEELIASRGERLTEQAAAGGWTLATVVRDVLGGATRVIFGLIMMLIAYFAFLLDGARLVAWIQSASPLPRRPTREILRDFRRVSRSVIASTLLSALAQAVIAGIGYAIAGVPGAFFFAFLTGVAALIPAVGTAIVTLPIAGVLLATGQTWQGIFLGIYWVVVVSLVDNVIKPLVVRGGMRLSSAIVFFSLIGGLLAFGPIGLIVGPLTVSFFLAMVRFERREMAGKREPTPAPPPA